MNTLVSIGRFSQLTRLTLRALRLYDELGLLAPAAVDEESGYRYYRLNQAATAERIRALRELEMGLEDIREVLRAPDEAAARRLLGAHRDRLAARLEAHRAMIARLETLMNATQKRYDVSLKDVPEQAIAFVREQVELPELGGVLRRAMDEVFASLARRGAPCLGAPLCAYPIPELREVVPVDCCVPTAPGLGPDGRVESGLLPAGPVAYTVTVGPYRELTLAFQAVAAFVADQGLEISGPLREIYLEHDASGREQHRVEVAYPVRRS